MKRLTGLFVALCLAVVSLAQQRIGPLFVEMPDSVLPLLTKINRADCIDFLESNMKAEVKNRFDRISEMTTLTSDYISLQLTPVNRAELKLLPVVDSLHVICLIRTVCGDVCDSRVDFYSVPDWSVLSAGEYVQLPSASDFLPDTITPAAADTLGLSWEELRSRADMLCLEAGLMPDERTLRVRYATPDYMSEEDSRRIRPLLKRLSIIYDWKDGRFVRREE